MGNKKVSAIITTYKRDNIMLERAINSINNQTFPVDEILLIDDNDDVVYGKSLKDLEKKYEKLRYIKQKHSGACVARNRGIKESNNEFIAFLDDDDIWLPEKIEKQMNEFIKNEDAGLVYCSGYVWKESINEKKDYYNYPLIKESTTFKDLLENDIIGSTSQPLIKKKVFDEVGYFMENQPARQDYEMWLRISRKYVVIGLKEKLFIHTQHGDNQITKSKHRSYIGYKNIYNKYKKEFYKNSVALTNISKDMMRNVDKTDVLEYMKVILIRVFAKIKEKIA